jgi:hypothetical protein
VVKLQRTDVLVVSTSSTFTAKGFHQFLFLLAYRPLLSLVGANQTSVSNYAGLILLLSFMLRLAVDRAYFDDYVHAVFYMNKGE